MAKILAVCVSEKKGTVKHPVKEVFVTAGHGIIGDAHAGSWHRQISLLAAESVEKVRKQIPDIESGAFGENILTSGVILWKLPVGTLLRSGDVLLEVTQIGKECHKGCEIRKRTGDCIMPREGIFARVLEGGTLKPGDEIFQVDRDHADAKPLCP